MEQSYVMPTIGNYYSELSSSVEPEGIAHFIFEDIKTPEDLEKAIIRCQDINDLRALLYEDPEFDNTPRSLESATFRHNRILRPKIEKILQDFCDLYPGKFSIITD